VERLTLTARVEQDDAGFAAGFVARFVARIDGIDVQGEGDSPDVAREELIQAMLSWISSHDCSDSMTGALTEAGFPEIDDDTELELEFPDFPGVSNRTSNPISNPDASVESPLPPGEG
jgi:hypothetical protein